MRCNLIQTGSLAILFDAVRQAHRHAIMAVALLLLTTSAHAESKDPIDATLDACLDAEQGRTTAGMIECTDRAISSWEARLNETYKRALAALDPKSGQLLLLAQR